MVRLLETDHLSDQLAALNWLRQQSYVRPSQIAAAGNSFGGVQTLLGAEREPYCAAVNGAGGAASWAQAPELRSVMTRAARRARAPVFFIQAENDHDLAPTRILSAAMKDAGKPFQVKIYPRFGNTAEEGHSFAYRAASV
jgi:dipeptidyl aminopeptidase/acylaminoacyl peptidase